MFAQKASIPTHWTPYNADLSQGNTMKITSVFAVDHVEIYNGEGMEDAGGEIIEIGVFSEDGICRCAKFPTWRAKSNQWIYGLQIYGESGWTYTFKVFNHNTGEEMDLVEDFDNIYVHNGASQTFGKPSEPVVINFHNPSSGYTLDITPYEDQEGMDHYYLIASPVGAIAADQVTNLTSNNYDLYSFDQAAQLEWINHRNEEGFTLQPNVGYLYANSGDGENDVVTLTFNGTPTTEEFVTVDLTQAEAAEGLDFPDWNLVGNPFEVVAYPNQPFYAMENGAFVAKDANTELPAMNGAFVVRTDEVTSVTFSKVPANKVQLLALNLSANGKVLDRAIVSFGQGQQLPKFQLFKNSSKLYIPQDGNDYALVRSQGMASCPSASRPRPTAPTA